MSEPKLTPSICGTIPDLLKAVLAEAISKSPKEQHAVLVSSKSLCNRFIMTRWSIRPSQRRRHKHLFSDVRKVCRDYFNHLLTQGRISSEKGTVSFEFVVYKFDEVRGNLILGFAPLSQNPFL